MNTYGIVLEFGKHKIWKLEDGRLYLDGIYLTASDARALAGWIKDNFKLEVSQ